MHYFSWRYSLVCPRPSGMGVLRASLRQTFISTPFFRSSFLSSSILRTFHRKTCTSRLRWIERDSRVRVCVSVGFSGKAFVLSYFMQPASSCLAVVQVKKKMQVEPAPHRSLASSRTWCKNKGAGRACTRTSLEQLRISSTFPLSSCDGRN